MMCMKNIFTFALGAIAVLGVGVASLEARVGERRSDIEKRLNSRLNGAYQYPKEDALREALELPYSQLFYIQPYGSANSFYFKRPDSELTTKAEVFNQQDLYGWELHIAYLKDVSVLEFYRRHGDPLTFEELEALMKLMAEKREARWVKTNYVQVYRKWDVKFENGEPRSVLLNSDNQPVKLQDGENPTLKDILPRDNQRYIYLEIPKDVMDDSDFDKSLIGLIYQDDTRATFENYNRLVEKNRNLSNARTSVGNASRNRGSIRKVSNVSNNSAISSNRKTAIAFNGRTYRTFEQSIPEIIDGAPRSISTVRYSIEDIYFGANAPENRTKEVKIVGHIPLQPDTALGYNYELSDGSVRALIYNNAVLFVDARYDSALREYMEKLYDEQSKIREREAVESVSKF